jgi:DNA polymerase-1
MLIDADLSALEWRVGAELSQDEVMIREIIDGVDIHTANAIAIFGDSKFRQESKTVSFRSLYGGSAYAFFMDSRMPKMPLEKWEEISDAFYSKYKGLKQWQDYNYKEVCVHGEYQSFTGRIYKFKKVRKKDGVWLYPKPAVCNYIVQGTATGDIVPLAMIIIRNRLIREGLYDDVKIVMQVHDSIVLDSPVKFVDRTAHICLDTFNNLPTYIEQYWEYPWTVPMTGEVKIGNSWGDMKKWG